MASRPDNPFPSQFQAVSTMHMHEQNREAIQAYAHQRLTVASADAATCQLSAKEVAKRSAGVFLWARFAADKIIEGTDNGLKLDSRSMQESLSVIPRELKAVYTRSLRASHQVTEHWQA